MADLAQSHFLVGFSILAARDVEVEYRVAGRQHLHLKRAVAGPVLIEFDEGAGGQRHGVRLRHHALQVC